MTHNDAACFPDMQFDIKEVLAASNRVVVRGEVSGTPSGDFFGLSHTRARFPRYGSPPSGGSHRDGGSRLRRRALDDQTG